MKQKVSFISLALLLCAVVTYAQVPYYGTPFYKQGFDVTSLSLSTYPPFFGPGWAQSGTLYTTSGTVATTTAWSTTNTYSPSGKNFVNADPASTYSLLATIAANNGLIGTFTSPAFNLTGKSFTCVGFSIFDYAAAFPAGYGYIALEITKDGGTSWETLWTSTGQTAGFSYTETATPMPFAGWKTIRINLPSSYDGQTIQLRFQINSPELRTSAMNLLIDGFFLSTQRAADAELVSVNDFSANKRNGFLRTPIAVTFANQGYNPISSINVGYKVSTAGQPDQVVTENYTLSTPIGQTKSATYTLTVPADLSLRRATYKFKAWVSLSGEGYRTDDTLTYTLYNTATDVPYKPAWLTSGNTADEWTVVQKNTDAACPAWKQTTNGNDTVAVCDASAKAYNANSYYFSRPIYLKAGKTYGLDFCMQTQSGNAADENSMQVFWANKLDTATRIGDYLFSKTNINNAGLRQVVYVTPTKDSVYYFVFRALCKAGNKPLYIFNVMVNEVQTFTVSASAGANGTITPAGNSVVVYGGSITYTIAPNTGYRINQVLVNGVDSSTVVSNGTYTFNNVTQNQSIAVNFVSATAVVSARKAAPVIYPNPVSIGAVVRIGGDAAVERGEVRIFDINGQLQSIQKIVGSTEGVTMPNRAGVYVLQVDGMEPVKVLVE